MPTLETTVWKVVEGYYGIVAAFSGKFQINRRIPVNIWIRKHAAAWFGGTSHTCARTRVSPPPLTRVQNSRETLLQPHQKKRTHLEFSTLFLMLIFTTSISYCRYLIYISPSPGQWTAQLLKPHIVQAACLCVLQLGSSHVHNGKSEHTKLGKIIVSFIDYTSLKQQVYRLFHVLFVRVIFTKSWAHGHRYRAAVLPATPVGRKLQTLLKWNWMVGCFHEAQPPTCLLPAIHLWRLAAGFFCLFAAKFLPDKVFILLYNSF